MPVSSSCGSPSTLYANEIHYRRLFAEKTVLGNLVGRFVDFDRERLLYRILWD